MPSANAQRALIHSVYRKAGLDPESVEDRPQYIEAHGTGTPAGDPIEAEALSTAFFGATAHSDSPIYTGSIKTVLGHTEGSAGIAALLKVTKAIQNATIPPNLWFQELNPKLEAFYGNVQIPTQAIAWPAMSEGKPKRASVNNFGFGGTNAHVIVESYETEPREEAEPSVTDETTDMVSTPFVFSAASTESLRANLAAYALYLDTHPNISVRDLAYTLRERRSVLPFRIAFPETNVKDLKLSIAARLAESHGESLGVRTWAAGNGGRSRIFGIFTGQGAQYARMGAELFTQTALARQTLQKLEAYLSELPEEDRPSWSLKNELLADSSVSRVGEAAISQPLCTAVQIILVDILRSANVHFDTVVGHSSGEIAAAYAAGYLSARDALFVAYYRGLHCKLAASPNGNVKGAMLAAGTSLEDATELCEEEEFAGRISVAASNSSSSVTISGDEDAINELAAVLDDEKKFNRRLKVDTAYHSSHMLPCFDPYVASLRRVGITVLPGDEQCTWISSVYEGRPINVSTDELADLYWAQNMTKPVLFSQAVQTAVALVRGSEPHAVVLEVGPHAALAGPAKQNIQEALQKDLPYHGTLVRGENAMTAFATCLGFLWTRLDTTSIDLGSCEAALCGGGQQFTVLADLPSYQWKHEAVYWAESRRSHRMRLRDGPYHQLLGNVSPDSAPHILRWKNVLKPREMTWLEGHQVQNQVVLPASAYVCTAIEAAQSLAGGKDIQLIELSNFHIHNAITFDQNDARIEVQIELSHVRVKGRHVHATFTYSAGLGDETSDLALAANGELKVLLVDGAPSLALFPERQEPPPHMIPVQPSRLYDFMKGLEYDFSGPFQSLTKLERNLGNATCIAKKSRTLVPDADHLMVHPVDLDAAFQSVMLAYSYPGDDQLRLLHLPTSIAKLRVNPAVLASQKYAESDTTVVDSTCSTADRAEPGEGFSGSVNMYAPGLDYPAIQVDHVKFKPVGSDANNDRDVFYKMHWVPSAADGTRAAAGVPITERDHELMFVLSRIAAFYLRQFEDLIPEDHPARYESPLCHYMRYARHMTGLLKAGEHRWAHLEWLNDTEQDVFDDIASKGFTENSDVKIMLLVGATMPRVFKGETTMLEHFRTSGLLDEYYSNGFGTKQSTLWVASVLKQLTDRNPHLSMMEIGAGTGSATKTILQSVGHDFASYTFTDISSSFFENAAETFSDYQGRMVFKVCNAEIDPVEQGFEAGTYDVVIAFMVVHACANLEEAVANLRKLLKPGGLLVLGEGASDGAMQAGAGFIFGTLPGWWRGVDEGRTLSPLVSVSEWEVILKKTGFSGIDTMSPPQLFDAFGITLFVSTALDERIEFARDPLRKSSSAVYSKVVVIGGSTSTIMKLAGEVQSILAPLAKQVMLYASLEDLDDTVLDDETVIVSLVDLEAPVFKDITSERWFKSRRLFETKRDILWLTSGRLEDEPYCNMTVGFGRSAMHEEETLRVQYVDVANSSQLDAQTVAQYLLRFTSSRLDSSDILYTKEPEVIIDAEGRECPTGYQYLVLGSDESGVHRLRNNQFNPVTLLDPLTYLENISTLFSSHSVDTGAPKTLAQQVLSRAVSSSNGREMSAPSVQVGLETLARRERPADALTIIDWTSSSTILPARVTRFEITQLFKADKTYWLVGLSGALGISLCDWMIERGVRYLVLTSRSPKIDARWIQNHEKNGVSIKILLCDVTDEAAIKAVHKTIVDTLPPIVGLLNGVMVLRDVSVRNMEYSQVTDVIRPKVLGSIHLDRIFHDVDLDFFVLLSSINCVIGNVGQANYAAANMGMIGVAGHRRKRGLRSSVVNVGAIIGVGYITQSDRQLDVTVAKTAMMHLSEQDFHQIFAECMEAGHLDNDSGPEISTGLLQITQDTIDIPPWYSDPKFKRFQVHQSATSGGKTEATNSASTQELLLQCRSQSDVTNIIRQAYCAQLRRILQVSTADEDLMMMRGVDLGFDSLLSVDVRSWFLKNFRVSIPVLKIMANDVRMSSLVDLAAESIPAELVPNVEEQQQTSQLSTPSSSSSDVETASTRPTSPESGSPGTPPLIKEEKPRADTLTSIDWDLETTPPSPSTFPELTSTPPKLNPEIVVLTGCSGLLGHHLLATLIAQPSIKKVICLATRNLASRLSSGELPPASDRIEYHAGDLTAAYLGLSPSTWTSIFQRTDAVIHNGSDTSHLKYYSALKLANVESAKQLVSTCLQRHIPFHYVSSAGVALFAEREAFPPVSCTDTGKKPPADGSHGYMCGKWVCEKMLERVYETYSLPIVIQRPSTIIRSGDDATVARAGFDWVNSLLHFAHKTQTVPRVDYNAGAFDLVSVDTCCSDVVRELSREGKEEGIAYVNNVGDVVIPMTQMADVGLEKVGRRYEVLGMEEWVRTVVEAGMHPAVAALIETFDEPGVERYPVLLRE
ncbi:lovastatin nonaketide synthase [Pyrenophora tritici-repentis Pt-1C-BFP]|uniref:Lovastatin nonaketide synthase n=1 Tax=Pyrenophora tritici-repentis (strain Pt-1C-BFP) TaxID=426418 RepID=B2W0G6_PYRTR|nr:lovastatin nonaketide synthase [Pyrenophora tritici-repentis Pt-1C-BFP]EDU46789.1 lovastatin nonaketide synthase [Pyrenophora tritici-repentis Pt-1C-BFP]